MKNLNHAKIYFIGLVIFCLGLVFTALTLVDYRAQSQLNQIFSDPEIVKDSQEAQVISDYQTQIRQLLPSLNIKDPSSREQAREKLFALKVPKIYQNFHFKLISTLDRLGSGAEINTQERGALRDFYANFSELGKIAQDFILNNL